MCNLPTQSSHDDLLPKSEFFDSVGIACDAAGITFLRRSSGMLPRKFGKIDVVRLVFLHSE